MILREHLLPGDDYRIRRLAAATGFFYDDEVQIAGELAEEWLAKGEASGYRFILAEEAGQLLGYVCFGLIPCTKSSYDLYWIAVRPDRQGQGLGRQLIRGAEERIGLDGGRRVYIETSDRPAFAPTRAFYQACGYQQVGLFADFYDLGDAKVVYGKMLA